MNQTVKNTVTIANPTTAPTATGRTSSHILRTRQRYHGQWICSYRLRTHSRGPVQRHARSD
jgi:hypothetical protein